MVSAYSNHLNSVWTPKDANYFLVSFVERLIISYQVCSVIRVGVATITASLCVQCLGVCIDRHIDMKKQVSQTISACSFYLRNISHISRFLPRPTKERVVNDIITSRLDYCNARLQLTSPVYSEYKTRLPG